MRKRVSVFLSISFFMVAFGAFAQSVVKTSVLIDADCAKKLGNDPAKIAEHKVSCLKTDACKAAGYGIVVNGKFLKFDANGNNLIPNLLEKTQKAEDMKIRVNYDPQGEDSIYVFWILEAN